MLTRSWLMDQPQKSNEPIRKTLEQFLLSPGATVKAAGPGQNEPFLIQAGSHLALTGPNSYQKHFFCDWIFGFIDLPDTHVMIDVDGTQVDIPRERTQMVSLLGRSPLLYGETVQESLNYRTQNVRKGDLLYLVEKLYGPTLKKRVDPNNPLFDKNGKPIPTHMLTAREHLEIAQINLLLQKTPIAILDFSSELMQAALEEGFVVADELLKSRRTVISVLPENTALSATLLTELPITTTLFFR